MLVVDASAMVEAVTLTALGHSIAATIGNHEQIHVPEAFHTEMLAALRGLHRGGHVTEVEVRDGLQLLAALRTTVHPVLPLAAEIWALRHNLTAYDAAYLALARSLDAGLLSTDGGLRAAAAADGRSVGP